MVTPPAVIIVGAGSYSAGGGGKRQIAHDLVAVFRSLEVPVMDGCLGCGRYGLWQPLLICWASSVVAVAYAYL